MKEFIVNNNDAGQRLDKFLLKAVKTLPHSLLYKAIRLKKIKVNRKRCQPNQILVAGDQISLYLNDEFFKQRKEMPFLSAPAIISVVYEDDNILLVDKPCGLVVHEDNENNPDTLIHRVQHYLYNKGEFCPKQEASFAPALCNRIDRNTCGLVIVAKNAATLRVLNQKIKDRELAKYYLCLVRGSMPKQHELLTGYLKKEASQNIVKFSNSPKEGFRKIITEYTVLDEKNGFSLLEVNLHTGRTHQIRAHLASIGHPLLGDGKYGINRADKKLGYKYQALCAYKLSFTFTSDAGNLNYLNGQTFEIPYVWFQQDFELGRLSSNSL